MVISLLVTFLSGLGLWYLFLPALSLHSFGMWAFIIALAIIFALVSSVAADNDAVVVFSYATVGVIIILAVICWAVSSPMFRASSIANIAQNRIHEANFTEDVPEEEYIKNIALMDTESAKIMGNREMGYLTDLVSQFVPGEYSTINIDGKPMKVAPLQYSSYFKYNKNKHSGIPGYIAVDPVTQDAKYVEFEKNLKYVPSAYFSKDLYRHLRTEYSSYIFEGEYFELDDQGAPYYVCPYLEYNVGLFGGKDVAGAVLVDPVTGETTDYAKDDIPTWVDRVYDGDLLVAQFDNNGTLKGGFWNSLFAQTGCVTTTKFANCSDYGYKAFHDDLWVFTGVTSVNSDKSNIGFILGNCRTGEIRQYQIAGADEESAMHAAEGLVQQYGYVASFPSVINVDGTPAYIMVLKDNAGLTKMYGMVNVESYQICAVAETQEEVLKQYKKKMNLKEEYPSEETSLEETAPISVLVDDVRYVTAEGNTFVYVVSGEKAYKMNFMENESIVLVKTGDTIELITSGDSNVNFAHFVRIVSE